MGTCSICDFWRDANCRKNAPIGIRWPRTNSWDSCGDFEKMNVNIKIIRTNVYKLIDGERKYQEAMPQHQDKIQQANTPVASWVIYMEKLLIDAKNKIYNMDDEGALIFIRKCTAVGVACMEYNDTPAR